MFTLQQAAQQAGIAEGLLIFWINVGKFKPSIEMSTRNLKLDPSLQTYAPAGELFGWNRFAFTAEDIERLRGMIEKADVKSGDGSKQPARPVKAWNPKADPGTVYTPAELCRAWDLSVNTIRRMFEDEAGVMKLGDANPRRKRRYVTLRIPHDVALRVYRKLSS